MSNSSHFWLQGSKLRQWKTKHAVSTIGVSILSSAITTITASIPLCFTTIQLFSKFGKIVAINTLVAIFYTLTVCTALLSTCAPSKYSWNKKWLVLSLLILAGFFGGITGILYLMHLSGVPIPGPSSGTLFWSWQKQFVPAGLTGLSGFDWESKVRLIEPHYDGNITMETPGPIGGFCLMIVSLFRWSHFLWWYFYDPVQCSFVSPISVILKPECPW